MNASFVLGAFAKSPRIVTYRESVYLPEMAVPEQESSMIDPMGLVCGNPQRGNLL